VEEYCNNKDIVRQKLEVGFWRIKL